ncbi:oligosaccharide repeat unit polymerase family protein [Methanobacterium sp.]|uniref:oligosaccharide repeat unit polymerase family protein n=1 Tax=Methanobacterium sp. TaxID=2164 RepID=UPI0025EF9D1C|nr:oligosaccharide repeat unit polymerase family protein [Methanobacterium sp.]MBI5460052.1 oligosaccharide repeat unit polymerase family protein [Methanobacterium sp.]MDY9924117.1 oligosaccharide repeat unit polymerase family protein [Methanobacterium sp.]
MKFKSVDLFSPYILVVIIALYIALAAIAYQEHLRNLQWISNTTWAYVLMGTLFFIAGVFVPKFIYNHSEKLKSILGGSNVTEENSAPWYNKLRILLDERVVLAAVLIGIFLQILNLYLLGGIPILSGYLKFKATTDLWRISYPIFLPAITILLAKYPRKWYYLLFIIGLGVFAINGYRTTTMAILISGFITLYYTRKMKTSHILISILLIGLVGVAAGYIAVMSIQWQQWSLNPLQLVAYRAGFTMMVFDKIVHMAGATGGDLFHQALSTGHPRVTVGQVVLNYPVSGSTPTTSITSTIFGPAVLDFGFYAMAIQMFIIGAVLQVIYATQVKANGAFTALYAIVLTHTMIWVETGPTDSVVYLFYLLALVAVVIYATQLVRNSKRAIVN